jgi:AbrB family looped-hinge helix DNA binding protein
MGDTFQTTIDSAGRLVLPKAVREEAGILPGMTLRITVKEGKVEIEPLPRDVQIVQRGPLWIAVPATAGRALSEATVEQVLRKVRERGE